MNRYATTSEPSLAQLGKATGFALAAAGVILVTAVLPAEYGIDPTGAGRLLGLNALNAAASSQPQAPAAPIAAAPQATLARSTAALRSDEMSMTLQPGEGAEVKASVPQGGQLVFSWSADAPVRADMHGEPHNARPNEFSTYWKEKQQQSGSGSFTAPFAGSHGWFWRNKTAQPVTIKVRVSGFYDKLYRAAAS